LLQGLKGIKSILDSSGIGKALFEVIDKGIEVVVFYKRLSCLVLVVRFFPESGTAAVKVREHKCCLGRSGGIDGWLELETYETFLKERLEGFRFSIERADLSELDVLR
jgi:hypothetical protein